MRNLSGSIVLIIISLFVGGCTDDPDPRLVLESQKNLTLFEAKENQSDSSNQMDTRNRIAEVSSVAPSLRYALLIGNESYPNEVGPLSLPHEDVELVKNALLRSGFLEDNITVVLDATRDQMLDQQELFAQSLSRTKGEGVGFYYYSGHGGSYDDNQGVRANYFLPTGAVIENARQLRDRGVSLAALVGDMHSTRAKAVFIISDACRNTLPITSARGGGSDKSFVRMERRAGLFLAFATADGATTPDDGLFAKVLSEELPQPSYDYYDVFKAVQRRVGQLREIDSQPFVQDGLEGTFCFVSCPLTLDRSNIPSMEQLPEDQQAAWQDAMATVEREPFDAFNSAYPESQYARYAQLLLDLKDVSDQLDGTEAGSADGRDLNIQATTATSANSLDTMNPFILQVVEELIETKTGLGYDLNGNFTGEFDFGDERVAHVRDAGTTSTVSIVLEVIVRSMEAWSVANSNDLPSQRFSVRDFLNPTVFGFKAWVYVFNIESRIPEYDRTFGVGARDAFLIQGVGRGIKFQNAQPGDFIYFNRTTGSGQAGVFLDKISQGEDTIGFSYFSSFDRDNGVGVRTAYFTGNCPSSSAISLNDYRRDCAIIRSDDPRILSVSRLHDPNTWTDGSDMRDVMDAIFDGALSFEHLQSVRYGDALLNSD